MVFEPPFLPDPRDEIRRRDLEIYRRDKNVYDGIIEQTIKRVPKTSDGKIDWIKYLEQLADS